MKLAVISHKVCWRSPDSPTGFITDGGFPQQIGAISELFDETRIVVPCKTDGDVTGLSPLTGKNISVVPLTEPKGEGFRRKLNIPFWLIKNCITILRETRNADAIHAPIPGDVGTIGMVIAMILRKPLFVRHCGNWLVQRTLAERFWKWSMEYFAGGRNVMLATGGADEPPSGRNPNIKWIFATSLRKAEIESNSPRELPRDGNVRLIISCRQEMRKGTDVLIDSMPEILKIVSNATLDVVGDGSQLNAYRRKAAELGLEKRVTFHGKVVHSEVIKLLKNAHIFCYPTSASEGFPKVVLEALAIGLPVITTKVSVLPKLIGATNGLILDRPTPSLIAAAVRELCLDQSRYMRISLSANDTARSYSLEKWRDSIGQALREAWEMRSLDG